MFRDRLRDQLEYKGLLRKELSQLTGISKRTIDTYLDRQAVLPNVEIGVRLAKALDVTVEYLVTGEDSGSVRCGDVLPAKYAPYRLLFEKIIQLPESVQNEIDSFVDFKCMETKKKLNQEKKNAITAG
ncbi:helix-turn-helix domain-containing protein [Treponema brennaborense]|uniref:Helix-turn-helix domain protein n=1 Tax=Treponema brennaborense (strain DSM 12168 / CIP 105900 / DD5/3) TaxID=906968 RepID=F4LP15_TREBD|nr:helix-turn-helix transcriptional regulator [Treponema brennaborense]AEE15891.1 helix-turn-helix domain protein [Treponema brennaborense DSM 12168]